MSDARDSIQTTTSGDSGESAGGSDRSEGEIHINLATSVGPHTVSHCSYHHPDRIMNCGCQGQVEILDGVHIGRKGMVLNRFSTTVVRCISKLISLN